MSICPARRGSALCASVALLLPLPSASVLLAPSARAEGPWTYRVTTDKAPVTDTRGDVWQTVAPETFGTGNRSYHLRHSDVAGTDDDALFSVNAWGAKSFRAAVPNAGVYRVRLLAAEDWYAEAGRRVYDVKAEEAVVEKGVDLAARAGKGHAYEVSFDVPVTDGALDLAFVAKLENPLVSAVEIVRVGDLLTATPDTVEPVVRTTAWNVPVKDNSGQTWTTSSGWSADARRSTALSGAAISGTVDDVLFQNSMWGMTAWSAAVPAPGEYKVRLSMVEGYWNAPGKRVFDVMAEGSPALPSVDVFEAVGQRSALTREFTVRVADGRLDLGFIRKVDQPTVSAIAVDRVAPGEPTPVPTSEPTTGSTPDPIATPPAQLRRFESRMVARPTPVVDKQGRTWERWSPTLGSWRTSSKMAGWDIKDTEDDELYRANVWDAKGYQLNVPASATYRVRLLLAEDSHWDAGKRVFDVVAEGRTQAADVDIAAVAGVGRAHDVVFDVPVSDGRLDVQFVVKADLPLVSAIEVTSTSDVPISTAVPYRAVKLAPNSFYTADISSAPVRVASDAMAAALAGEVSSRYGGIAAFNAYAYTVGYHVVAPGTPRVQVDYNCYGGGQMPPGLYDGPAYFKGVPVPEDGEPAVGEDGQMTLYDPATDQLWEFWQMRRDSTTGRWSACWGGRIDDVSTEQGIFAQGFGASASGLAVAPGMIALEDIRRGRIDHAIALSIPQVSSAGFSWPANRSDGKSISSTAPKEGQRLRLDPSVNLDEYDLTPIGRMVAEAAQRYGFVVTDAGGAVAIAGESGAQERRVTGVDPWDSFTGGHAWDVLHNFPWSRVQFLPENYGRVG